MNMTPKKTQAAQKEELKEALEERLKTALDAAPKSVLNLGTDKAQVAVLEVALETAMEAVQDIERGEKTRRAALRDLSLIIQRK